MTLDPRDWAGFRKLAHRMLDDLLDHVEGLTGKPVWQAPPEAVHRALDEPVPFEPQGLEAAYEEFRANVLPYSNGNAHPRFWGWVQGNGNPAGMLADLLASGMNPMCAGFDQAPALVEHRVLAWLTELMGFPVSASGVLVSSGTMANVLSLAVARHARRDAARPAVYCSNETHGWIHKAVRLLGLGEDSLIQIPVDSDYRIDVQALREAICAGRAAGLTPICVIGNAGTVNTGAIDDLDALASLCARENIWFHVDGAFGALLRLSNELRPLVAGIELAGSLAFDLHKWVSLPFECACFLVRDAAIHEAAFSSRPEYMRPTTRGVLSGGVPFADRGIDLSRGFKALKVWLCFKAYGVSSFARLIERNVEDAHYLAALIDAHPDFELLAPAPLNIVCFRHAPPSVPTSRLDALNQELLLRLQESGEAVISSTVLSNRIALRAANVNHRSTRRDFDRLLSTLASLGADLAFRFIPNP